MDRSATASSEEWWVGLSSSYWDRWTRAGSQEACRWCVSRIFRLPCECDRIEPQCLDKNASSTDGHWAWDAYGVPAANVYTNTKTLSVANCKNHSGWEWLPTWCEIELQNRMYYYIVKTDNQFTDWKARQIRSRSWFFSVLRRSAEEQKGGNKRKGISSMEH